MNWFDKHLNWTYVISNIIISIITGIIIAGAIRSILDDPGVIPAQLIVGGLVNLVITLAASAWILRKKGQTLLWLLLILVSSFILFILALVLPNNRSGQGEKGKISDSDYYKSRGVDVK
jgi:Na+/melibiose symporter-like transporter